LTDASTYYSTANIKTNPIADNQALSTANAFSDKSTNFAAHYSTTVAQANAFADMKAFYFEYANAFSVYSTKASTN
jgi:hypothetical protein